MSNLHSVAALLMRRWRLLSVLGVLLLFYALLGFVLVPRLIHQYVPQYVSTQLQRQLTLGTVQFNPFTLTLQIRQAALNETSGARIVSLDYLLVNAELRSALGGYHFKKIQLDGPNLAVIVNADGRLNLDFSDPNSPAPESPEPKDTTLPALRIGELQLNGGKVQVEDHTRPKPFRAQFAPIQFTLQDFRTEPQHGNAFHFSGASEAKETFDWQGEFTVQPLGSKGTLRIGGLQAATLQNYLQDTLPMRLLSGALNLEGEYEVALADTLQLRLRLPSITAQDVQIAPLSDNTPWVTLPKLVVNNTQVLLRERDIKVGQIALSGMQLNAWLDAERNLNLLELLGPDEPSDAPWNSAVQAITLENAIVQLEDRSVTPAAAFTFNPVQLKIQGFSSAPNTRIDIAAALKINQADLNATGSVDLDTLRTQLKLQLRNFALKDLQAYADAATDLAINDGLLSVDGDVVYKGEDKRKTPELTFAGKVEVANLSTADKLESKDFIKWRSVQLQGLKYSMAPDALEIAQIVAREPYGRIIIGSDGMTNIQHILRTQASESEVAAQKEPAKPSTPAMRIRIAKTLIENGSANFTDNSVQPIFSTNMQRLNGSITGLSSANDSRARIKLDGNVDNYAPVAISGEANFLAAQTFSDVAMKFSNMELTTFNPYSGKFAGYSIARGKLATEIRYQIVDRKLDAQHHIVIDQLEFGAATDSKDAVPLPIKLAVALLKDRNGVIDLNLPVSGSVDDPQFKVGPIIWKAFVGLLTKIVTAPFAALGSLLGGDSEQLAYVDFTPGSATLSNIETTKLATLAKALVERPQLKLNIPLTVISDADAAAMNDAAFATALNNVLPSASTATPAQRLAALTTLHQRTLNTAPVFSAAAAGVDATAQNIAYLESLLKPQFAISAADRDLLTRARADAVQIALLTNTEVAPERVYLTARSNEAKSPEGVVRMELKLE